MGACVFAAKDGDANASLSLRKPTNLFTGIGEQLCFSLYVLNTSAEETSTSSFIEKLLELLAEATNSIASDGSASSKSGGTSSGLSQSLSKSVTSLDLMA